MKNLKKYIRNILRESINMQWLSWSTFSDCYYGLNDKFRQDFDECLREGMIGEEWYSTVEDVDEMAEEETLEDKFHDLARHTFWSWDVDIFRKYSDLHTPDRVMIALWFIANKKTYIGNFAFSVRDTDELRHIAEQCKDVVDMYGLVPSFKDEIDQETRSSTSIRNTDDAVGNIRPFKHTHGVQEE